MNFKLVSKYLSNLPGWSTSRKIVVIESDDWGSVYMPNLTAYNALKKKGVNVDYSHFLSYDTIESNQDFTMLYQVLRLYKDKSNRHPVISGLNIVANPDFKKIAENEFSKYEFEPFYKTYERFEDRDQVMMCWQEGISKRLFVPFFHGREHLNITRWMSLLKQGNPTIHFAFQNKVSALRYDIDNKLLPNLRAAFDIDKLDEINYLEEVINSGMNIFEEGFKYKSKYFLATNGPFNNKLEKVLHNNGVKYIGTAKVQKEPLGDGKTRTNFRYLGKKNTHGQTYITRNCLFEPNVWDVGNDFNWIQSCMSDINVAFLCHKPAVICSHRVNYVGGISRVNREKGIEKLNLLLKSITNRWPNVEFLTSVELGDLISSTN